MAPNPTERAERHNDQGKYHFSQRRYDEAAKEFTKAIKHNPIVRYYQNRGIAYFNMIGMLDDAEQDFRHVQESSQYHFKSLYFLGNIMIKRGKFDEAIAIFMKALMLRPTDPKKQENWQDYVTDLERGLKLARKRKFEEEERQRADQENKLHSYLLHLMENDFKGRVALEQVEVNVNSENLENEVIVEHENSQLVEKSKRGSTLFEGTLESATKMLKEIFTVSAEKRDNKVIPEALCGKITLELMKDPVITPSGITYDRDEITRHLRCVGHFDPVTRTPLSEQLLFPNYALKEMVEYFVEEHPWAAFDGVE